MPGRDMYLVSRPSDVQYVLQQNPTKFTSLQSPASEDFEKVTRNSIVSLREDREYGSWSERLRVLADDFKREPIASKERELAMTASSSLAELAGETQELLDMMRRVTIRLMGVSLFSQEIRAFEDEIIEAVDTLRAAFKRKHLSIGGPFRRECPDVQDAIESLKSVAARLVRRRMESPWLYDDALSRWLNRVEPHIAKREVVGMLLAGFTTLSAGLTWAVYELLDRPMIQEQIRSEAVRGPMTTAAWKETIRLYPPLPIFGRRAKEDITIGEYNVTSGGRVIISPFVTHRDPDYWPNPTRFDPDRFIDDGPNEEFSYYPFGAGPHACLGEHIANVEATVLISTLFDVYDVSLESDSRPGIDTAVNLQPDEDVRVSLTER